MSTLVALFTTNYHFPLYIKIILSFLGGLLPVLIWLWFWEHEDKRPEPKRLLVLVFCAGMVSVVAALGLEQLVADWTKDLGTQVFLWAAIEELLKFGAAYITVLSRLENDHPIDSMIYMIMVALGFSALENALFLFNPISKNATIEAFATGNLRFIGATLLHTITSSIIGFALALTFYRSKRARFTYVTIGVITAVVLHAFFNLSIMIFDGSKTILPFYAVWIAIVAILLAFEKVKRIKKPS